MEGREGGQRDQDPGQAPAEQDDPALGTGHEEGGRIRVGPPTSLGLRTRGTQHDLSFRDAAPEEHRPQAAEAEEEQRHEPPVQEVGGSADEGAESAEDEDDAEQDVVDGGALRAGALAVARALSAQPEAAPLLRHGIRLVGRGSSGG